MFSLADLPDEVAIFPLPGALLLPRAHLPLHLFEPRYLAMLDDVLKTGHRLIGMVQPRGEDLHAVGCAGRVTAFTETPDRRYMITLTGISRFRVGAVREGFAPYRLAKAGWNEFAGDLAKPREDPGLDRTRFLAMLARYFEQNGLESDQESLRGAEDELLIDALSMTLPFEPEDKQALLEAPDLPARRKVLETLIEYSLRQGQGEERLQ